MVTFEYYYIQLHSKVQSSDGTRADLEKYEIFWKKSLRRARILQSNVKMISS